MAATKAAAEAAADAGPIFHGLFRTGARREAVAPVVSALWGAPGTAAPPVPVQRPSTAEPGPAADVRAADQPAPLEGSRGGFDLFQDRLPDARTLFRGRV
jgi:hypothetical protein